MTIAGPVNQLKRLSQGVQDPRTRDAVRQLEDKLLEMERRLLDAEARLTAGGL